jgi:hypothetical protein
LAFLPVSGFPACCLGLVACCWGPCPSHPAISRHIPRPPASEEIFFSFLLAARRFPSGSRRTTEN